MATFRVPGEELDQVTSRLPLPGGPARVVRNVRIDPATRGGGPMVELEASDDGSDLVEVELENGVVFWTSLGQLREDTEQLRSRQAAPEDLPTRYPAAAPSERGAAGIGIKALKFLDVDVPREGALWAAARIEAKLAGEPGFYRLDSEGELSRESIPSGSQKVLVFVHGTGSSTQGAFSGLTKTPEMHTAWKDLQTFYDGRIFGFEHKTLTESPVDNAVQFLEALPAGTVPPLHLVSHSRGGLVGDLLAHGGPGEAFPRDLLKAAGVEGEQRRTFERLNDLLATRQPTLARFVRVACPAGGTSLASGRLDIYLSVLIKLLGAIPGAGPILAGLGELVAAVAKERTKPDVLPGLKDQMPKSPLIRALNGSGRELDSDLTVISGDSDGLFKNLANLFYWGANDLVVNTRSMYRGAPRRRRRWYLSEGRDVHHTNYFSRTETVAKVIAALKRRDDDPPGFSTTRPRAVTRGHVPAGEPRERTSSPAVILVPGVMGSHLAVIHQGRRNRVWLDLSDLLKGRIEQLAIGSDFEVEADAVVERAYGAFAAYLRARGQHVIPHPYDWRDSLHRAAEGLAEVLEKRLQASEEPIRIVAHSTGGLVVRCLIAERSGVWQQVVGRGGRLVQLGTPNRGSHLIPYLLQGEEKLLRRLARLDLENNRKEWVDLIARFPGLLEMAPQTREPDFFQVETWDRLKVLTRPRQADLNRARKTVETFDRVDLKRHPVVYVAGRADRTPTLTPGADRLTFTSRGDGRVTWESGIPEGIEPWFIDVEHGSLADCEPAFDGLLDLVTTGKTNRLSRSEPVPRETRSRGYGDLAAPEEEVFPTQQSLETAALGMEEDEPWLTRSGAGPTCRVRVIHGDLAYAEHPVMVGHYAGDPILHAEAAVDRRVDGALSDRHQLDLYPRNIGSHEIVLPDLDADKSSDSQGGALVIGLGTVGDLTPGDLARSVEAAVVRYVHLIREREKPAASSPRPLGVTSLLIGSGEAGLSLEQVVESILSGVRLANRRLETAAAEGGGGVAELDLVELYEDRALEAQHILNRLASLSLDGFEVSPHLVRIAGGYQRKSYREPSGWWAPLAIRESAGEEGTGEFEFTAHGHRARVAAESLQIQTELVQELLHRPLASASPTHRRLSETLFELLLPQRLKHAAGDRSNVLLVLDKPAAAFPWELLADRLASNEHPYGVDAGLVRQLRVENPRRVSHPESNVALVVGDPPSQLVPLPGAQEEARGVADFLQSRSWRVARQIHQDSGSERGQGHAEIDAESIITTAMTGDYRILHLAGHGSYDPEQPRRSGLVVGGDPAEESGIFLSPAEVVQMRLLPELVFINCCHLGRIESTAPHLLAANLATQFIEGGVRAVVAAGWAVEDQAALTFARTFYEQMFAGRTFGEAVLFARRATFRDHGDTNTWAAYQCYGDPGFRLLVDPEVRRSFKQGDVGAAVKGEAEARHPYVDPVEIVAELGNLKSRAHSDKSPEAPDQVRRGLANLEKQAAGQGWEANDEILLGLGRAYAEIGDLEQATRYFERALAGESGLASLRDLEQLANFRARHAADRAKKKREGDEGLTEGAAAREIRRAIKDLRKLLDLAKTSERFSLLGSAYKRLVQTHQPEKTNPAHLASMAEAYARAAAARPDDLYARLNALAGVLVLGGPWPAPASQHASNPFAAQADFGEALKEARDRAPALARQARDFWPHTYLRDAELLAALYEDKLGDRRRDLASLYQELFRRWGSPREHASVLDHLRFLKRCLEHSGKAAGKSAPNKPRRERLAKQATELDELIRELR